MRKPIWGLLVNGTKVADITMDYDLDGWIVGIADDLNIEVNEFDLIQVVSNEQPGFSDHPETLYADAVITVDILEVDD